MEYRQGRVPGGCVMLLLPKCLIYGGKIAGYRGFVSFVIKALTAFTSAMRKMREYSPS